jgi:UDP-glucose:(heptosyl)LPS alpha-1,3-glucosyltransferase
MKKVLICMIQLHKNSGSARTALENIRYFKERGFEVHVAAMTMDKTSLEKMGTVPHKMLPFLKSTGLMRRKWYNWQVQNLRKKIKPDITLGHGDIQNQDVVTLHNCVFLASELIHKKPLDPEHEMAQTHGEILRKKTFKKMIANSQLMKEDTIKRFQVPAEKIDVIYPSVDTKIFFPQPPEVKRELRQRFKFPDKVIVSLVTSGNFKKRGLDLFFSAIKALPLDVQNKASFRVLGKDEDGKYAATLLHFDPGLSDIESYYNAIDVFVLPARIEEFGRVVLEAMASGLPVITTDKVGAAELLENDSKQFVIPSENTEALTQALIKVIQDPDLRIKLGKQNATSAQIEAEVELFPKFDRVFVKF